MATIGKKAVFKQLENIFVVPNSCSNVYFCKSNVGLRFLKNVNKTTRQGNFRIHSKHGSILVLQSCCSLPKMLYSLIVACLIVFWNYMITDQLVHQHVFDYVHHFVYYPLCSENSIQYQDKSATIPLYYSQKCAFLAFGYASQS